MIEKIEAADACIFLDECQFSRGSWSNRNRMPTGAWLTIPVDHTTLDGPINRVRISEHGGWRERACRTLRQHYGETVEPLCVEIRRPFRLLVGLNLALLRIVLDGCDTAWNFQSHLDGGHATVAVSDDAEALLPISDRLAMMVAELGGDTYLSGPSGFRYLSEEPFLERGVAVEYFPWSGPNPCSAGRLAVRA